MMSTFTTRCWGQLYEIWADWSDLKSSIWARHNGDCGNDWVPMSDGSCVGNRHGDGMAVLRDFILVGEDDGDDDIIAAVDAAMDDVEEIGDVDDDDDEEDDEEY